MRRAIVFVVQLLFLLLGPAFLAYVEYARWTAGYRTPNWWVHENRSLLAIAVFFAWCLGVLAFSCFHALTLIQTRQHWKTRALVLLLSITALVSSVMVLFGGYRANWFERGRLAMQAEIDLRQLADDCLKLHGSQPRGTRTWLMGPEMENAISFSSTLNRTRPNGIVVDDDSVLIELHGGMDHYGYLLERHPKTRLWVLSWYTESVAEKLLEVPALPQ